MAEIASLLDKDIDLVDVKEASVVGLQPVPESTKFENDSIYIRGASLIKPKIDQKYHLFYSRWPY